MLPQGMLKLALTLVPIVDYAWQFVQDCDSRVESSIEAHTHNTVEMQTCYVVYQAGWSKRNNVVILSYLRSEGSHSVFTAPLELMHLSRIANWIQNND